MNSLTKLFQDGVRAIDATLDNQHLFEDGKGPQRLFEKFGVKEIVLGEHSCRAINGNDSLAGILYITPSSLYFSSTWYNPNGANAIIKVVLPYSTIKNLQQAGETPSVNPKVPAVIPLTANPTIRPSILQIFTNDNLIHQFFAFGEITYFNVFNVVAYAWRSFHNHPHPEGTQAPYIIQPLPQQHVEPTKPEHSIKEKPDLELDHPSDPTTPLIPKANQGDAESLLNLD